MTKISQSLIKGIFDYIENKECGLILKEKFVNKNYGETTPSQLLGQYFEFITTGALPKSKIEPIPEKTQKGILTAPFQRVEEAKLTFDEIFESFGIEKLKVGYELEDDEIAGTIDIYAKWNNELVFIDLKYSALIDDRWSEFGWHEDFLHNKTNLMIQGVHYKELARRILGVDDIPFYYFIFSSKDPKQVKIIRQDVTDTKRYEHDETIKYAKQFWHKIESENNFQPKPTYSRCNDCFLNKDCIHKAITPEINVIQY